MATGRIYKRGAKWYIDISTGKIIDGQKERLRYRAKGKLKSDALDQLSRELSRLNTIEETGRALDNDYLISDLFDSWSKNLDVAVANDMTRYHYKHRANRFIEAFGRVNLFRVADIEPRNIDETIYYMTHDISNRSINDAITAFKAMLEYGVSRKYIAENPFKRIKKLPKKNVLDRRALTVIEGIELLANSSKTYYPIWLFVLSTGVRKEELVRLTWDRIDFDKKVAYIHPTDDWKPKTDTSVRALPLSDKVIESLKGIKRISEYVFATKDGDKRDNNLVRELRKCLRRAFLQINNLPLKPHYKVEELEKYGDRLKAIKNDADRIDLHCLRYTFCTHLISNGVDIKTVQKLMGHSSPEVTLRIYAQYCHGNAEVAINKLPW